MEKVNKEKITALLPELIELVNCNVTLISYLRSTGTIALSDEKQLDTFTNQLEKSKELFSILFTRENGYKSLIEGLEKTGQTGALKFLNETAQIISTADNQTDFGICEFKQIPFQTKEAIELFTGRRKELEVLLKSLLSDGGTASIIGIGGVGKTELAKMFLQNLDEEAYEYIFKQIVWINCESVFTASADFTNIAKDYLEVPILGSSSQQRDISSILNDVYDKLQKSKSLVVLDNVVTRKILQMFMPKTSSKRSKLSILITSQNSVLKTGTLISLGSLELNEAVEFVKKGLDVSVSTSEEFMNGISDLVLRLEMFPLAISQAIGFIKEKMEMSPNYKPQDYLVDLDRIPERLLDGDFSIDLSSQGKTTYKTLALALMKIEASQPSGVLAAKILAQVAFMSADNIPSSFFSELAEKDNDSVESALVLIKRLSIIKYTPVGKSSEVYFSMHRLAQDVLRIRVAQKNETETIIHSIMTSYCLNLGHDLINHALETWKHAAKIHSLVKEFLNFPKNLVRKMHDGGQFSSATDFATSSLIVLKQNLSIKEHADSIFRLQAMRDYTLSEQGKFFDSLQNLEATLNEARPYLNTDHVLISKLRYYIASFCFESGQIEKAKLICDELYNDFKSGNIVALINIYDIGSLQRDLKRFENALETANYVLANLHLVSEIERENLENYTRRLKASIHGHMANYDESINLYSELLQTHLKKTKG